MDTNLDPDDGTAPAVHVFPDVEKEAAELAADAAHLAKDKAELEDELAHHYMPKGLRGILPEGQPFEVPGPLA